MMEYVGYIVNQTRIGQREYIARIKTYENHLIPVLVERPDGQWTKPQLREKLVLVQDNNGEWQEVSTYPELNHKFNGV